MGAGNACWWIENKFFQEVGVFEEGLYTVLQCFDLFVSSCSAHFLIIGEFSSGQWGLKIWERCVASTFW